MAREIITVVPTTDSKTVEERLKRIEEKQDEILRLLKEKV